MAHWTWGHLFLDSCIAASDICTFCTFLSLVVLLARQRSAAGLSLQSLVAIVSARSMHLATHAFAHYTPRALPFWPFAIADFVNVGLGLLALLLVSQVYRSYERDKDNFGVALYRSLLPKSGPLAEGPLASAAVLYVFVGVTGLLWYVVRRSKRAFLTQYFFCYYEVLCAVMLLPQLSMFHKDKKVSSLLSNFIVFTAMNRMCTFAFWIFFPWCHSFTPDNRTAQMLCEFFNILILSDFLYYWVRAKLRGERDVIIGDYL